MEADTTLNMILSPTQNHCALTGRKSRLRTGVVVMIMHSYVLQEAILAIPTQNPPKVVRKVPAVSLRNSTVLPHRVGQKRAAYRRTRKTLVK